MSRTPAVLALLFAGCVGHGVDAPGAHDPRPVDMTYRVKVIRLYESGCSVVFDFTDGTAKVDLMARPDGTLVMSSVSAYVPFYGPIEGVESDLGNVSQRFEPPPNQPKDFRSIELDGIITPDAMDLTVRTEEDEPLPDGTAVCRRAVRLIGKPRGLLDPSSPDGRFRLNVRQRGISCNGSEPSAGEPIGAAWVDIDTFSPERFTMRFLTGTLAFDFTPPEPDGSVDWTGVAYLIDGYQATAIEGQLRGTLKPDTVSLALMTRKAGYPEGCWAYADLEGKKALPSLDGVTGEYRARVRIADTCTGEGDREIDAVVTLIEQDDGAVWLFDGEDIIELRTDGNAFRTDIPTGMGGVTYRYSGTLAPTRLDYTVLYEDTRPASACRYRAEVTAVKRFVFPAQ